MCIRDSCTLGETEYQNLFIITDCFNLTKDRQGKLDLYALHTVFPKVGTKLQEMILLIKHMAKILFPKHAKQYYKEEICHCFLLKEM